jgi:uncharacterized protein involved in exopolysaccharide biosynthesis
MTRTEYERRMPDPQPSAVSVFTVLSGLLHYRRVIVAMTVCFTGLGIGFGLLTRGYEARSVFRPESEATASGSLLGLAANFGMGDWLAGTRSVDFYASIVYSRDVLERIAEVTYRFPTERDGRDSLAGTIEELYEISGENIAERKLAVYEQLRSDVSVSRDVSAGIVAITVKAPWASLAEQINAELLGAVNQFHVAQRSSRARAERAFLEGRVESAERDLRGAEETLAEFLRANRSYLGSPELEAEADRLRRQVDFAYRTHVSLAESLEQARIAEVRDTPIITVIERPEDRAEPNNALLKFPILGFVLGLGSGTLLSGALVGLRRMRQQAPAEYAELTLVASEAMHLLPWSRSRRSDAD